MKHPPLVTACTLPALGVSALPMTVALLMLASTSSMISTAAAQNRTNAAAGQVTEATLSMERIFLEPYLPGVRPEMVTYTPDGTGILYRWNDSSYTQKGIYRVDLEGRGLTEVTGQKWPLSFDRSPDGKHILYIKESSIRRANVDFSGEVELVRSEERLSSPRWSPDGGKVAYVQNGNVWVLDLKTPGARQITRRKENEPSWSLSDWVGNEHLLLTCADRSGLRTVYFPEYVDEFVKPGASSRGIAKTSWYVAPLDTVAPSKVHEGEDWTSSSVSTSGRYVALDIADAPMKKRTIRVFDIQADTAYTVFTDSTEGWIYGRTHSFAPTADVLMFQSEQTGWNHIYTVRPDGSTLRQHTAGEFDIPYAEWLNDKEILYASTEADLGERHLIRYSLDKGTSQQLTRTEGYRYQFRLSPDKSSVVYAYTTFNQPYDLYRIDLRRPRGEVRLTNSIPEEFNTVEWQKEDYIRFTGRDGETELSMSILKPDSYDPETFDPAKDSKYPVVVFVHGAGSLQNVFKGWSNSYYREYMFHQRLAQKGYVVVEVDYRHSTGYGRKFREDVTNWMGKYETEDIIDGLDWITANGDYIDRGRVGIYGGSYGGFMALYATTVEPDHFHAAAALRAVTNWRNYFYANPWYTLPRLGDPAVDSLNYQRSSPLDLVEDLKHPVLILHGLVDDNVGFQDAVQYIEELIQMGGKDFDMMMYPSEPHGFTKPMSWLDEYLRIERFFDHHIKGTSR